MTDWPDLALLELLVTIERTGSLTAAARELGMAQPNASRAIGRLERRTGLVLLVRTHSGSTLSPSGRQVVEAARPVLEAAGELRSRLDDLARAGRESLQYAASQTIAEYLAPRWLAALTTRHRSAELGMRVTNSEAVMGLVQAGVMPLGFVETPQVLPGLSRRTVHTDRLVVVVAPSHRWARRRRPLTLDELADTHLVVRERGSGTRETLEAAILAACPERLPQVGPHLVLSSNVAVLGACSAGVAPAVLSELAVANDVEAGRVVVVPLAEPESLARDLQAVWLGTTLPPGAAELVEIADASRSRHA